ncbi:dTMP kinase, partial [Streptomyces somaliensis DSM 40738]|nr:dTMP kinase [Streptomyces somaliensis DSM 40738]
AAAAAAGPAVSPQDAAVSPYDVTVPTPVVRPDEITQPLPAPRAGLPGDDEETQRIDMRKAEEPAVRPEEETRRIDMRKAEEPAARPEEETRRIDMRKAEPALDVAETAVLPPVRDERPDDRVPPGFFRDEVRPATAPRPSGGDERTRELPQVDERGRPRRGRPEWAEETPLDDLPSLADELLGGRDDEDGGGGRG